MKEVFVLEFQSMDTSIEVRAICEKDDDSLKFAINQVPNWFAEIEARVSRFKPSSELTQINKGSNETYEISPVLLDLINNALASARMTDGIFDPTVLNSLILVGYNRSFSEDHRTSGATKEQISSVNRQASTVTGNRGTFEGYKLLEIDPERKVLSLPRGLGLDLGGIAKGWIVDQSLKRLKNIGSNSEICINAGGDLNLFLPEGSEPWEIDVQNPFNLRKDLGYMNIEGGSVATSSILKRSWFSGGTFCHHIIDPRTGLPSCSNVVAATVVAPTAAEAEVWSKTLCILGFERGFDLLAEKAGWSALCVLKDRRIILNQQMEELFNVTDSCLTVETYSGN